MKPGDYPFNNNNNNDNNNQFSLNTTATCFIMGTN